jgi:hypothetical protein
LDTPYKIVILSEAKDLLSCPRHRQKVTRFAQDDNRVETWSSFKSVSPNLTELALARFLARARRAARLKGTVNVL